MNVVPIIAPDHAARVAGVPLERALDDGAVLAEVLLAARDRYRHDLVVVWCHMLLEAEALGARISRRPGELPHVVEPARPDDLQRPFDPGRGRIAVLLEALRIVRRAVPAGEPVAASLKGPFSLAALALGPEHFLAALHSDPGAARAALQGAARFQEGFARALAAEGGIPWFGDPLASGSILGGRWFDAFARAPLRAVVAAARDAAGKAAVHVCGDPTTILDALVETGADWLSLELPDPAAVRPKAKGAALFGGVPTDLLLRGTAEEVFAFCHGRARTLPAGCILASDCDVPEDAPADNVHAMVEGAREAAA